MMLEITLTVLLGSIMFGWGMRFGRLLARKGATANDLFKGKNAVSLAFLGLYMLLLLVALYAPQIHGLPIEWRVSGLRVTWTILRIVLLGFCGLTFAVSWRTARLQIIAVFLLGCLGIGGFTAAEIYFLAPIHADLRDNLQPNGIFWQTSNSSCAPAALATVLRRWGLDATESTVARLAGTSRLGTSMPQLIVAAAALGMRGIELSPTWEQMQQINRPGVLSTWLYSKHGRDYHAVALIKLDDQIATIADPAFGKFFEVPRAAFDRIWRREYLPIFRPEEVALLPNQVTDYLVKLGYLQSSQARSPRVIKTAIAHFQSQMGIRETGEINVETALYLTGPFLTNQPKLNQ
jgi:predicted double-glycine peptidase